MLVGNSPAVPSRLDFKGILIYRHFQRTISKLTWCINNSKKLLWKVQNHYKGQELSEKGLQLRLDRNLNHLMLSSHKKQVYESHTVSWSTYWHQHKVKICIFYTTLFVQSTRFSPCAEYRVGNWITPSQHQLSETWFVRPCIGTVHHKYTLTLSCLSWSLLLPPMKSVGMNTSLVWSPRLLLI